MGVGLMENPAGSPAPTKILLVFLCLVLFAYGVNGQNTGCTYTNEGKKNPDYGWHVCDEVDCSAFGAEVARSDEPFWNSEEAARTGCNSWSECVGYWGDSNGNYYAMDSNSWSSLHPYSPSLGAYRKDCNSEPSPSQAPSSSMPSQAPKSIVSENDGCEAFPSAVFSGKTTSGCVNYINQIAFIYDFDKSIDVWACCGSSYKLCAPNGVYTGYSTKEEAEAACLATALYLDPTVDPTVDPTFDPTHEPTRSPMDDSTTRRTCYFPPFSLPETGTDERCDHVACPKRTEAACLVQHRTFGETCEVHCANGNAGVETWKCADSDADPSFTHAFTWERIGPALDCGLTDALPTLKPGETTCGEETLQEAQKWRALVESLSESLGHLGRRNLKNVNDVFEVLLDTMHTGEILNVKY